MSGWQYNENPSEITQEVQEVFNKAVKSLGVGQTKGAYAMARHTASQWTQLCFCCTYRKCNVKTYSVV